MVVTAAIVATAMWLVALAAIAALGEAYKRL